MTPPTTPDDTFSGFTAEGLEFLTTLGGQNKAWFEHNRPTYQAEVVAPCKLFVSEMHERITASFAPNLEASPKTNGSIAPINNDLRFNPDNAPYKDHLLLRFWEGETKKTAATLMIRISERSVGFAAGAAIADLDAWRKLVDGSRGEELANLLVELERGRDLDVAGEGYKKVPKPYAADHPREGLLRHKSFQARWSRPTPKLVRQPSFAEWCCEELAAAAALHRWLVNYVAR